MTPTSLQQQPELFESFDTVAERIGQQIAAQAHRAEQQGNTFLSPSQAPRRMSGGERQRGGIIKFGRHEASPEFLGG